MQDANQEKECCPKFDPTPWDNRWLTWENKLFIKKTIPQFFHMPWPPMIGKTIMKMWAIAEKGGATPDKNDSLMITYDPSPWKSEFFMAVTKELPNAENAKISGNFFTKVFDGPYNHVPKWMKEVEVILSKQNKKVQKYYFYYTTCPKCAKKYGHNYVVVFAQVQ